MSEQVNRWNKAASRVDGSDYAARFQAMADRGQDVHGEAALCTALVPTGGRVLDAGCGTGRVAKRLQELGFQCAGVDADASMLEVAKRTPGIEWLLADLADAAQMSIFTGRFELVVAAGNVVPLLAEGTESGVISTLAACLVSGGLLVAGFGLDAAHLPLDDAPFGLADYDGWCAAAGLTLISRYPAWDGAAGTPAGYAVSVHRR